MPSKSPQQHRFMEAAAHNPEFAKKPEFLRMSRRSLLPLIRKRRRRKPDFADVLRLILAAPRHICTPPDTFLH